MNKTAMAARIEIASEKYITIDSDLQNDVKYILMMYELLIHHDTNVVEGFRVDRKEGYLRELFSRVAGNMIIKLTGIKVRDFWIYIKSVLNKE